jgi:hypothetical protein
MRGIFGAIWLGGWLVSGLSAQELRVRVADPGGNRVVGALVTLRSTAGAMAAIGITNEHGRARLRAAAGSYTLVVERPGFVDTTHAVTVPESLDSIVVRHAARRPGLPAALLAVPAPCRAGGLPDQARGLWVEAERALRTVATGEDLGLLSFNLAAFDRSMTTALERRGEQVNTLLGSSNRPPNGRPASELWQEGFLTRGDSLAWAAPDPSSFLVPEFLTGHCFGIVNGSAGREGMIGLRFEPADQGRVGIAGTFWVEPASRELKVIDYRFTAIDKSWRPEHLGGSIEIHRLEPGIWVERFWYQRTPNVNLAQNGGKGRLISFREQGAEVTAVSVVVDTTDRVATSLAIRQQLEAGRRRIARMTGIVIDTLGYPVPEAEVAVLGTDYQATTDREGIFTLDGLPLGLQIARVRKIGYRAQHLAIRFAAGEEWSGKITIKRLPTTLGEIVVVGRWGKPPQYANTSKYDEFYRRRAGRSGRYLTRADIESRPTIRISQLLGGIPGLRVGFDRPGGDEIEFVGCAGGAPGIWLDGQKLTGNPAELIRVVTPNDIEAMEVYVRETQIPAEFRDGSCAAIVMWTR